MTTTKNQNKACPTTHFDHCCDLFRAELSRNQIILQNIHLRMENTSGLCRVFDKTEAQQWNESHVYTCYITMRSISCQGDKSLVPMSRIVISDWSNITSDPSRLFWNWRQPYFTATMVYFTFHFNIYNVHTHHTKYYPLYLPKFFIDDIYFQCLGV